MTDDKFLKSILNSQKALRSYADSTALASRAAHTMLEAQRVYDENSAVRQMMQDFERHKASMRFAWGSMWRDDLDRTRIMFSDIDFSFIRDVEKVRLAASVFESQFRMPEITEIGRLIAEYQASPISEALAMHAEQATKLQQAMESMCTPWIDNQKPMSSISGFAKLQGIGHALRNMPTFDENLTASLRINLGDWRDPIAWSPEIFTNLSARSEFYTWLGFNHALTDFPMPAFEQGLDLADLRDDPPPLVARYRRPIPAPSAKEEDEGFSRTNMAYGRLLRLEIQLRAFIDECMTQAFGADWPKHRLPTGMYDQWQTKKKKGQQADGKEWPLIAFADFTDYAPLICRRDNWREIFMKIFVRPESVCESFQRLYPIRVDTMHARPITQDDELFLCVETIRIEKVIRKNKSK